MKLLAFETATEACSVALHVDGQVLERFEIAPRRHAELSLPWAEALLAEAGISRRQLDGIALSRGPGAFTGVRLAIAIAQGIALALDRPLLPVSTLQVLALRAPAEETQILSAIDARMGELYVARFERVDGLPVARDAERVCAPAAVALPEGCRPTVSAPGSVQPRALWWAQPAGMRRRCRGHRMCWHWRCRRSLAAKKVEPAYLRDNVALTLVEQQAAREAKARPTAEPLVAGRLIA
jgi:tRNA threonylcarbamoyladenosine biosynthesis protein TsaB